MHASLDRMFVHEACEMVFVYSGVCVCETHPLCAHRIFGFSLQFVALSEVRGDGSQGEEGQQALCADYNHLQTRTPYQR